MRNNDREVFMELALEDLKDQSPMIISRIGQGHDITLLYNGKSYAKIIPIVPEAADNGPPNDESELFGLWKDRTETEDVDRYVRKLRQGRAL